MEALAHNITGTCPLAFAGGFGALFAQTIAAIVTAHCSMIGGGWPEDRSAEVLAASEDSRTYDFIIVGAGTAGSLLACRLSASLPSKTILLIEAGDDPGLYSEVPMLLFLNNDISWNYKTNPDNDSCLGLQNKSCIWGKGKAMGGSSSINALLYVRGHPRDFETWKEMGNNNWGYEDVLPHFKIIESSFNLVDNGVDREEGSIIYDIYRKAWEELGYNIVSDDHNAVFGTRITTLMVENGQRKNTAKICLNQAINNKKLTVMKNTLVQKVIMDAKTKTAQGVTVRHHNGDVFQIKVKNEVILSAGSVATPQILMLSGIGPKKHLDALNVETILNLPVGQNLQDHLLLPLVLKISASYSQSITKEVIQSYVLKYLLNRKGPFSGIGVCDFMTFVNTENQSYPDIQFHHTYFAKGDNLLLRSYFTDIGYTKDIVDAFVEMNRENNLLGIYPTLLHPKSRGQILLQNTDPQAHPVIKPNYFKDKDDVKQFLQGIRYVQRLLKTDAFKAIGVTMSQLNMSYCKDKAFDKDDYWECYIKHIATTIYHPVGTAKMGSKDDATAVVDNDLIVRGMRNLRVVDASIMPKIVGGNTMAATLMIADKAVDIIKKAYTRERDEM